MGSTCAPGARPSSRRCGPPTCPNPGPAPATRALAPVLGTVALWAIAVVVVLGAVGFSAADGLLGWDVRFAYLPAAEAALDGRLAVPGARRSDPRGAEGLRLSPAAPARVGAVDFLPVPVAAALVAMAMLALVGLTLYVAGVRDARCYAAAFLWVPAISGVLFSNVSIPLALALASSGGIATRRGRPRARWGWRSRPSSFSGRCTSGCSRPGDFAPPHFRSRSELAVTLGAWAVIGFAGLLGTRTSCGGCRRSSRSGAIRSPGLPRPWILRGCRPGRSRSVSGSACSWRVSCSRGETTRFARSRVQLPPRSR